MIKTEFLCDPYIYDTTSSVNRIIKDLNSSYEGRNRVSLNSSISKQLCSKRYYDISRFKPDERKKELNELYEIRNNIKKMKRNSIYGVVEII